MQTGVSGRSMVGPIIMHSPKGFFLFGLAVGEVTYSNTVRYPMLRNSASGPEIELPGRISAGL